MRRITILAATLLLPLGAFGQGVLRIGALKGPTGVGMIQLFENPPALPQGDRVKLEGGVRVNGGPKASVARQLPVQKQAYLMGTWAF